jgi:hypothetical protein
LSKDKVGSRPDIVFAVGHLQRFRSNPTGQHLKVAKRTLAYLKGTIDKALAPGLSDRIRERGNMSLIGYCLSDYTGDRETRRTETSSLIDPVKQSTVATSTCEAEYMAMTEAARKASWLGRMLQQLDLNTKDRLIKNCCKHLTSSGIDMQCSSS